MDFVEDEEIPESRVPEVYFAGLVVDTTVADMAVDAEASAAGEPGAHCLAVGADKAAVDKATVAVAEASMTEEPGAYCLDPGADKAVAY